ncbi:MAG: hypothetical protein FJ104_10755 [Deltaproteobacteria bacterium]|nr:hypothetical protein [Deltaproteobacteria bacterium]
MSSASKKLLSVEVEQPTIARLQRARVRGEEIVSLSAVAREALAIGLDAIEARKNPEPAAEAA